MGEEHDHTVACYGSVGCCGESTVEECVKNVGSVSDLQQSATDYESITMVQVSLLRFVTKLQKKVLKFWVQMDTAGLLFSV
ncbi:hypothetical protein ACFXTI_019145 [Malus domestica]